MDSNAAVGWGMQMGKANRLCNSKWAIRWIPHFYDLSTMVKASSTWKSSLYSFFFWNLVDLIFLPNIGVSDIEIYVLFIEIRGIIRISVLQPWREMILQQVLAIWDCRIIVHCSIHDANFSSCYFIFALIYTVPPSTSTLLIALHYNLLTNSLEGGGKSGAAKFLSYFEPVSVKSASGPILTNISIIPPGAVGGL